VNAFNIPEYEGKTLIMAYVVNSGDRPTTLTRMALMQYANPWKRLRNKTQKTLLIMNPNLNERIPYELKPGRTWTGVAVENEEVEAMARKGYLICAIMPDLSFPPKPSCEEARQDQISRKTRWKQKRLLCRSLDNVRPSSVLLRDVFRNALVQ
jgi:hypothetical protein